MNVFEMAEQLLEMRDELAYLRHENAALKAQNDELLRGIVESNQASERQLVGWIDGLLSGKLRMPEQPQEASRE